MSNWLRCIFLFVTSLTFVSTQQQKQSTQTLYLKTTWDGKPLGNSKETNAVEFSAFKTNESNDVIVQFNVTAISLAEDQYLTPDIFGVLFKGEKNSILQVEVHKGGKSAVTLYGDFDKLVQPKETLNANFNEKHGNPNTWNGTINIPLDYFPRGTNEWAVYANYTQGPERATQVLSLINIKSPTKEIIPNLLKQEFFTSFDSKVDFTKWSPLWQSALGVTPGGEMIKPASIKQENEKKNEGSILEQGLTVWILASAIFCGMLHAFVLSL